MTATIGFAIEQGHGYLKLGGELRHDQAGPLDLLAERLFEGEDCPVDSLVVDLNDCQFLDSTLLGLLATLARGLLERELPAPTLFSTHPEINQLLRSLCLDQVFTIVEQATRPGSQQQPLAIDAADGDPQQAARTILKAHEALIELGEANRIAFQPVVDLFRGELGAEHGGTRARGHEGTGHEGTRARGHEGSGHEGTRARGHEGT